MERRYRWSHESEWEGLGNKWVLERVWWEEREYSMNCVSLDNVMMLWTRMGSKLSLFNSLGGRKGRRYTRGVLGCDRRNCTRGEYECDI